MAPWPLPKEYQYGCTTLWLSDEVAFAYKLVEELPDDSSWQRGLEKAMYLLLMVPSPQIR